MNRAVIPTIIEQHAEEAAFLWILRDVAVRAPHYKLKDIAKLDGRVEAHIDGLRIAGDEGWRFCEAGLQLGEAGEVFAAMVLALESKDRERIGQVLAVAERSPGSLRGLVGAFAWVEPRQLSGTVKSLLSSQSVFHRRIALAACAVHRVSPGEYLDRALKEPDTPVWLCARALRAVGELGRADLLRDLRRHLSAQDEPVRLWAAWSAVLSGEREGAVECLKAMVVTGSTFRERALQVALRAMGSEAVQSWLKGLVQYPDRGRDVVIGAGISGDPIYVPWLIKQMETPALARVAGESLSLITGVDIAYQDLEGQKPEGFESGPSEEPEDEDVALDPDEDLPWPDPDKIRAWWDAYKVRFQPGVRFLGGAPVSETQCHQVLATGFQRQRIAAALELALMNPGATLYEWRAPGWRQQAVLK